MKKLFMLFICLALPLLAQAQNPTAVTGTLVDPNGVPFYPATVTACLIPVTRDPVANGQHVNSAAGSGGNYCPGNVSTTATGFFTMSIFPNAAISPASTQYQFTVSASGTPPPGGKGPQTYNVTVTIAGTSQDVSASLNAVATALLNSGGGSGGSSYLGLVATRGDLNQSNVGAGTTWIMDRSAHIARQTIPALGLKIVWGNYYVNGPSQEVNPGSGTYEASIEYPVGVFTRCLFSGANTVVVAGLADAITDWCGPAIPNGAKFWVRALYVNVTGGIIFSGGVPYSATDEGDLFGSGAPTNNVMSGTIANGSGGSGSTGFHPYAIIGNTTLPTLCLIGDSRISASGDLVNNFSGDTGEVARTVGPVFAYTKIAVAGTSIGQAILNFTNRLRIVQYCSHVVDEFGINDIGGGASAATVSGNRTTLAGLFPTKPTYGTTLPTETTSTDSWATIANQTTTGNPAIVVTFNGLVRAGISGEAGYFDIANVVDPTAIGKWPVAANVFATTGSANYATTDGIHESPAMDVFIQNSNVINTGAFTRR